MMASEDKAEFLAAVKGAAEVMENEPGDAEDKVVAVLAFMMTKAAAGSPQDEQEAQEMCAEMRALVAEHKAAKA